MRTLTAMTIAILLLAACSDDAGNGTADAGTDTGSDAPGSDMTADADAAPDAAPDIPELPDASRPIDCVTGFWVTSVSGEVVDEQGQAIESAKVQLCVRNASSDVLTCLRPADSRSDGAYDIVVPERDRCMGQAVVRVILPVTDNASTYCRLNLSDEEGNVALSDPFVLFATTPATDLPAEGEATQERTVVFAGGLEIDVVPERLFLGGNGYDGLASLQVAPDHSGLCFVEDGLTLDGLYAFSPEGEVTGDNFAFRAPVAGRTAGDTATVYALGALNCTLPDDTLIEEGELAEIGTATVDATGQYLEGSGSSGLPCFSWLAYAFDD